MLPSGVSLARRRGGTLVSVLSPMTCASAVSVISRGKFETLPAQSRKLERKRERWRFQSSCAVAPYPLPYSKAACCAPDGLSVSTNSTASRRIAAAYVYSSAQRFLSLSARDISPMLPSTCGVSLAGITSTSERGLVTALIKLRSTNCCSPKLNHVFVRPAKVTMSRPIFRVC